MRGPGWLVAATLLVIAIAAGNTTCVPLPTKQPPAKFTPKNSVTLPPGGWSHVSLFELGVGDFTWEFARSQGCYDVPSNEVLVLVVPPAPGLSGGTCDKSDYNNIYSSALAAWNATNPAAPPAHGDSLVLSLPTTLVFDQRMPSTRFLVTIAEPSCMAFLTVNLPFASKLEDAQGLEQTETWASHYLGGMGSDRSRSSVFPEAVLAGLVLALPTFFGIILLTPCFVRHPNLMHQMNAFAAGVLASASFMLMYPEGMHLLGSLSGTDQMWVSGTAILAGFVVGFFLEVYLEPKDEDDEAAVPINANAPQLYSEEEDPSDPERHIKRLSRSNTFREHGLFDFSNVKPLAYSIFMADAIHNVIDGMVLGATFLSCDPMMGWLICVVMMLHELPQEIAGFFVLTQNGLTWWQAIMWNVCSAATSMFGLVLLFFIDIDNITLGLLLLVGTGAFLYISFVALVPPIINQPRGRKQNYEVLAFIAGTVIIGFTMLIHVPCESPTV